MEDQDSTGPSSRQGSEGRGKTPQVLRAGRLEQLQQRRPVDELSQQTGEGSLSLAHWEAQWQEFLRTLENPHSGWGIPHMRETPSPWKDAKAFLASFEQVAEACQWPKEEWVTRLLPALSGDAERAFKRLDLRDREEYGKVKAAVLRGDALSREKLREAFRHFCYQEAEGPRGAYIRLQESCRGWLRVEKHSKEQILELLILEQLLAVLPAEIQSRVRESGPESCSQAVALAEALLSRNEEQVPLEMVAVSVSEAGQDLPEGEGKYPSTDVKEEEHREVIPLAASNGEVSGELRELSQEKAKKGDSEGNFRDQDGQKWKEEEVEIRDKPIPCSGGHGQEIPVEEERPAQKRKLASSRIHSMKKGNEGFGKPFVQKTKLISQDSMKLGEKPYNCLECGESFRRQTTLTSHEKIHSAGHDCEYEEDEELHQLSKHKTRKQELIGNFRNHGGLKRQKESHMFKKNNKCVPAVEGDVHEMIHMSEETYKGLECGISSDDAQYNIHLQMRGEEESHKCLECGKNFKSRSQLRRHQRIHSGEKPFKCSKCRKRFCQSGHLLQHLRTHTGEKPFECSTCGKRFSRKASLQQHEGKWHNYSASVIKLHTGILP